MPAPGCLAPMIFTLLSGWMTSVRFLYCLVILFFQFPGWCFLEGRCYVLPKLEGNRIMLCILSGAFATTIKNSFLQRLSICVCLQLSVYIRMDFWMFITHCGLYFNGFFSFGFHSVSVWSPEALSYILFPSLCCFTSSGLTETPQ